MSRLPAVDLAPVRDPGDDHHAVAVVDGVHDPVVADPDPVVVAAGELDGAGWAWLERERVDRVSDAIEERGVKASVRAHGLAVQAHLVRPAGLAAYSRTSLQGTVSSRSARARKAARLSSRYSRRSMSSA